jgi:hypothetical protein
MLSSPESARLQSVTQICAGHSMVSISHLEAKNTVAFQFVSKLYILLLLPIPHLHNKPADFLPFILPDFESFFASFP